MVRRMYLDGAYLDDIQRETGLNCMSIYAITDAAGIPRRRGKRTKWWNDSDLIAKEGTRECTKCKILKDLKEFSPYINDKKFGRQYRCKVCQAQEKRESRYGLSKTDTDKLLAKQGGKCGICNSVLTEFRVDHCHRTGNLRGLLCESCNLRLGGWDDLAFRKAALAWLGISIHSDEAQTNIKIAA